MRSIVPLLALALTAGACANPTGPEMEPTFSVSVQDGLEQQLTVTPLPDNGQGMFYLESRLVNRGDAPVQVRVTRCFLEPGVDLKTRAHFSTIGMPSCIPEPNVITLAPGETSKGVGFSGAIRGRGRFTLYVRHAREPEMWGRIDVVAR